MHLVLIKGLGGLNQTRNSVVRLTNHPNMVITVYCGRKAMTQQEQQQILLERIPTGKAAERLITKLLHLHVYSSPLIG